MDEFSVPNTSNETSESVVADVGPSTSNTDTDSRQKQEMEVKDPVAVRKVQKADREKLRRDRLNEQFLELGNTLDPDRPKNDKTTILTDTIQVLKDLTDEVNKLRAECVALSEESLELMQEKNELREEKASLKSDIESLSAQYQQRLSIMFPWGGFDPSVVMAPPYSYAVPVPVPPRPIPMHPSLQPFPFFGNQNPCAIQNPCSTFIQYSTSTSPSIEQLSTQRATSSHISSKQDTKNQSTDHQNGNNVERSDDSNDVATDLELKMPGSSTEQDMSSRETKGKQTHQKERSVTNGGSSSRFSSSEGHQNSSSNSMGDISKSNK